MIGKNKVILGEKGSIGIHWAGIQLGEDIQAKLGGPVHAHCRRVTVDTNKNATASKLQKMEHVSVVSISKKRLLRSCDSSIDSSTICFVLRPAGKSTEELRQEK